MGRKSNKEGIYRYICMSDSFAVQQKLIQHCKATTLQQKIIKKKTHGEISPHICQEGYHKSKTKADRGWDGQGEAGIFIQCGSNKKLPACYEKQHGGFSEN